MDSVNWDVATVTRDMIQSGWSNTNIDPTIQRIDKAKRVNVASDDYVIVSDAADRDVSVESITRETYDYAAVARVQVKSADRSRRDEIWKEVVSIAQQNNKRSDGTPGSWDTLDVATTAVRGDEQFNTFTAEIEFRYSSSSVRP